ncbi:sulfotransferase [Burkholderia sp. HI2714]|uniref:sulfotransferase family protein n=1 Tax=Burkholderia sp. HI2714 TaxID=2015359 RepID=UPI000B79DD2F|nr:sulfotransferase [Burkholderia sp. HI2714]OXJ22442.1 sulfotransferase [Burkholderia sp. HI2714]
MKIQNEDPAFHFISGLPRSGSTLLAALLKQNPRFHAGMTSPVGGIFLALLEAMSDRVEASVFLDNDARHRILRGFVMNYFSTSNARVIFDTNRFWCSKLPTLRLLFPQAKVIACVRDTSWIIDSFERLVNRNALQPSGVFNFAASGTVYSRASALASSDGTVGFAYDALREAFYGEHAQSMLLVQYDTLTSNPKKVLSAIYDFIGEPWFEHDFDNVEFDEGDAYDGRLGTPGLHAVGRKVRATPRDTILPPDLFQRFAGDSFWLDPSKNPRDVRIV